VVVGRVYIDCLWEVNVIGEPALTDLLKIVQDLWVGTQHCCVLICMLTNQLFLDSHAGRKHFCHTDNWQFIQNFGRKSINQQIATSF
jgi:hypothetical protein